MGSKRTLHFAGSDGVTNQSVVVDDRTTEEAQAETRQRLADHYQSIIDAGFPYAGKIIQIDEDSTSKINAQASVALVCLVSQSPWPDGFSWITADNTLMSIPSASDMLTFGTTVAQYVGSLIFANRAHKDAIAALESNQACDDYDVTTGWSG